MMKPPGRSRPSSPSIAKCRAEDMYMVLSWVRPVKLLSMWTRFLFQSHTTTTFLYDSSFRRTRCACPWSSTCTASRPSRAEHREWCICHAAPHAHLLLFWRKQIVFATTNTNGCLLLHAENWTKATLPDTQVLSYSDDDCDKKPQSYKCTSRLRQNYWRYTKTIQVYSSVLTNPPLTGD